MGLFALSKMLDPAHLVSNILPILEKADASTSGSVSKAVFIRVIRDDISTLTTADCEKVIENRDYLHIFVTILHLTTTLLLFRC
jgi:hypothetical protein